MDVQYRLCGQEMCSLCHRPSCSPSSDIGLRGGRRVSIRATPRPQPRNLAHVDSPVLRQMGHAGPDSRRRVAVTGEQARQALLRRVGGDCWDAGIRGRRAVAWAAASGADATRPAGLAGRPCVLGSGARLSLTTLGTRRKGDTGDGDARAAAEGWRCAGRCGSRPSVWRCC
jgi:hypothetical protein